MVNDNIPLGVAPGIYTIIEAAAKLRISRRKMQDLVRAAPYYALNGNRKLFSEADIARLYDAMCEPVRRAHPLFFEREEQRAASSSADISRRLTELTTKKPRRKRP